MLSPASLAYFDWISSTVEVSKPTLGKLLCMTHLYSANIVMNHNQREAHDQMRRDSAEMRELLYQILTNQGEMRQVYDLQIAGEHVAEPIMEAGQNVRISLPSRLESQSLQAEQELRHLRENGLISEELMITDVRSTSPPPQPNDGQRYLQYQRGLINIHRLTGIPPSVKVLNGEVRKTGDLAIAGGTYSDIWLGKWLGEEKVRHGSKALVPLLITPTGSIRLL